MIRKLLCILFVAAALAAGVSAFFGAGAARALACTPGVDC
jgi:hypothetical protein